MVFLPAIGVVTGSQTYIDFETSSPGLVPPKTALGGSISTRAFLHIKYVGSHFLDFPSEICDAPKSEYNVAQCAIVSKRKWVALLICLIPLVLAGVVIFLIRDQMGFYFIRAHKLLTGTASPMPKPVALVICDPLEGNGSIWTYMMCLKVVRAEAKSLSREVKIMVPADTQTPRPGDKVQGYLVQGDQYVGYAYAPHVVAFGGS